MKEKSDAPTAGAGIRGSGEEEISVKIRGEDIKKLLVVKQRYENEECRPMSVTEVVRRLIEKEVGEE
jgi:hypothetical protein